MSNTSPPGDSPLAAVAEAFRKLWLTLASIPTEACGQPAHPGWNEPFTRAGPLIVEFNAAVSEARRISGVLAPVADEAILRAEAVVAELIERLNARRHDRLPGLLAMECIRIGDTLKNLAALGAGGVPPLEPGAGAKAPAPPRPAAPTDNPLSPGAPETAPGAGSPAWIARCGGLLFCSTDFGTVRRGADTFQFTPTQRACVEFLIGAWEKGRREFTNSELLEAAGSTATFVRDVFRSNGKAVPAWNNLVVEVEGKRGTYTLRLTSETA